MSICTRPECQTAAGCKCGPYWPAIPSPRFLPVNIPFPTFGQFTVVTMDKDGNVVIKTDQPSPFAAGSQPETSREG